MLLKELMNFLQQKGIFERYLNYVKQDATGGIIPPDAKVSAYLKNLIPSMYIWYPFNWSKTAEGSDFWRQINREWNEIIKSHESDT